MAKCLTEMSSMKSAFITTFPFRQRAIPLHTPQVHIQSYRPIRNDQRCVLFKMVQQDASKQDLSLFQVKAIPPIWTEQQFELLRKMKTARPSNTSEHPTLYWYTKGCVMDPLGSRQQPCCLIHCIEASKCISSKESEFRIVSKKLYLFEDPERAGHYIQYLGDKLLDVPKSIEFEDALYVMDSQKSVRLDKQHVQTNLQFRQVKPDQACVSASVFNEQWIENYDYWIEGHEDQQRYSVSWVGMGQVDYTSSHKVLIELDGTLYFDPSQLPSSIVEYVHQTCPTYLTILRPLQ